MNARQDVTTGLTIEQQLDSIQMSQYERGAVLHAARSARIRMFVNAIVWMCEQVGRLRETGFARPSPKH